VTPTLLFLRPIFQICAGEQAAVGLILSELPANALTNEPGSLALGWGLNTPPDGYAAVIGQEELVIITHPQNPLAKMDLAGLQAVYSGASNRWPAGGPDGEVHPWIYPAGEDIQLIFEDTLLKGAQPAMSAVSVAPDPQAVREAVAADPQAVGYLPRRWLDSQVKELQMPGLEQNSLRRPILALSKSEPDGQNKAWLLCLQDELVK
jgi:hypothetical protein